MLPFHLLIKLLMGYIDSGGGLQPQYVLLSSCSRDFGNAATGWLHQMLTKLLGEKMYLRRNMP